jgi:hypothetical protein
MDMRVNSDSGAVCEQKHPAKVHRDIVARFANRHPQE